MHFVGAPRLILPYFGLFYIFLSKVAENTRESKHKFKNMLFKFSPKLQTISFWRFQKTQGVPKSFWEKSGWVLNEFPKILNFVQFRGPSWLILPYVDLFCLSVSKVAENTRELENVAKMCFRKFSKNHKKVIWEAPKDPGSPKKFLEKV